MSDDRLLRYVEKGNRQVITDYYVPADVEDEGEELEYKVFIRLNAVKKTFRNTSFAHCVFDGCYLNNCVFDTCDFTGCRFVSSNFHQTTFAGCQFKYVYFDNCDIDDEILLSEAPLEENLRMHFARTLRTNYQQIGNAKAANTKIYQDRQRKKEAHNEFVKVLTRKFAI